MQRRHLGGLEISAVGLGCATMTPFYDEPDRDAAVETLRRAREIGVDFLDSSDAYGQGRNEELIAHAIRGYRGEYVIASKFGNWRAPDGSPTVLATLGGLGGIAAGHVVAWLAGTVLGSSGLVTDPLRVDVFEPAVLAGVIVLGILAGLLPAVLAYRTEVAENLAPLS
jgi:Aldo/keto reductase family